MRFEKGNVWIFSLENSILEISYSSKSEKIIYCLSTMWLFSYWTIVAIYVVAGISSGFFLQNYYLFVIKYVILKCNYKAIIGITLVCCMCVCEVCSFGQESYD